MRRRPDHEASSWVEICRRLSTLTRNPVGEGRILTESKRGKSAFGPWCLSYNETVDTPLDAMGQLFLRSSLFRSDALDAGYQGTIGELIILPYQTIRLREFITKGALLQVVNFFGLTMYKNAKLDQFVFHELKDKVYAFFLSSRVGLSALFSHCPTSDSCAIVCDVLSSGRRIFWCLPEQERTVMEYGLFQFTTRAQT
jgi:hypothetical protein